jgi:GT2 family glycosyltransferase
MQFWQCRRPNFRFLQLFAVLDHASHDNTLELMRRQEKELPEVRVVWAPENSGVADGYLRGYREALNANCDSIFEICASSK